jgi:hypothetical protein
MAASSRVTMFGLDVRLDRPLRLLEGGATVATGRRVELSALAPGAAMRWPEEEELISDERGPDGEVLFQIAGSELGYRIAGPRYGAAIVSPDASRIWGSPGTGGMADWRRLLIAQVLPFAAVIRGLEVLHASAVAVGGEAVAFLGRSGAGKTSMAMALCRLGATFLADDVLSVEREDGCLLGHPGAPLAGIGRGPREEMVPMAPHPTQLPLKTIFVLDRRPRGPARPRFEPVVEPQVLLAATFNLVLRERARLEGLLDVCALAAGGRVERVVVGPETDAPTLAEELAERMGVAR